MMRYVNNKYTAVFIAFTVVSALFCARYFSVFELLNGASYDLAMKYYPANQASEKIIVIEVDAEYLDNGDEIWLDLLEALLKSDAQALAFNVFPNNVSSEFYRLAGLSGKTVFGVHVASSDDIDNEISLPPVAHQHGLRYGLIAPPASDHGVIRKQHATVHVNRVSLLGFEKQITLLTENGFDLPNSDYLVNFIGNQHRIPKINIERILQGGLINELVSGRTVLIGINRHQWYSSYFTPVATSEKRTSEVMFHAFALDTLLSDRQITTIPDWIYLGLLMIVCISCLWVGQLLEFRNSLVLSLVAAVAILGGCWILLAQLSIWIAPTELLLTQWLSFVLVWGFRVNQEQRNLEQTLFAFPLNSREKSQSVSIYNSDEPWQLLISIINQTLNLNRLIFLERIPGDHRLKEISSMNCSMDDIIEKRRDYERVPYSIAIHENRPIRLERRYLKDNLTDEHQYMAPLMFAGEVLGFWVFSVDPDNIKSVSKFNSLTYSFMVQVSEILHYRHEWKKRIDNRSNKFWDFLRISGNEQIQKLNQSTTLLDKKVYELQGIFNSITTSCVLYDLFGRTVMINKDMEELARAGDFRLFNRTLLEFMLDMTELDESSARNMIQRVVFDHESISIPVTHQSIHRSFMLYVLPLRNEDNQLHEHIPDQSQVFQISGILCELVDVTGLKRLYRLKEQMFERFCIQVSNDLSAINYCLPEDEQQTGDDMHNNTAMQTIQGKVNEMIQTLDQVNEHMTVDVEHMLTNDQLCYPVNGRHALLTAVDKVQDALNQREIKLNLKVSELISLVYASPLELEVVLQAVLLTMINDTYDADEISIVVKQDDHYLTYCIDNSGIGLSDNSMAKIRNEEKSKDSELLNLNYAMNCVHRWGGKLNIFSEMGEGSRAEIVLRCFLN